MAMATVLLYIFLLAHFDAALMCNYNGFVEYDYGKGHRGPAKWGYLRQEWKSCAVGHRQSPINIQVKNTVLKHNLGGLHTCYSDAGEGVLENRRYVYEIKFATPSSSLVISGVTYHLTQFHFHIPSEHHINGKRFQMEMHLVHYTQNDTKIAVISVLFEHGGSDNDFLTQLNEFDYVPNNTTTRPIDVTKLDLGSTYYQYTGSFTTPSCTEGVKWSIMEKVQTASKYQIKKISKRLQKKNARPLQGIHNRIIWRNV